MSYMTYKDTQLSLRVPPNLVTQLDELAAKAKRSRSDFIRLVLEAEVERQRKAGSIS